MHGQLRLFVLRVSFVIALVGCAGASRAAAQTTTMPAPWLATDIGAPVPAGASSFDQGVLSVTVGGSRIAGTSDQFHFVYQPIVGDVEVIARVASIAYTNQLSSTGVMIRSSLAANAVHASALASAGNGLYFERRTRAGGKSARTNGEPAAPPRWVRVVRKGSTVTGYSSVDGGVWTPIGSVSLSLGTTAYVGVATTSALAGVATQGQLSNVSIVPLSLPAPQKGTNIGSPSIKGSAEYRYGSYTITGAGADIGGSSDQFYYVYQPLQGDADVVARVASLDGSMGPAKAGVMVRETLTAGSRHAFALIGAGEGVAFDRRIDPSGLTQHAAGAAGAAPAWVRLVRSGSQFQAYGSSDGRTWTLIGSDTVPMADAVYVGLAVTSRNTSAATVALADSLSVTLPAAPPNQPPTVALTTPVSGSHFVAPATIVVTASASDPENRLDRVEFYAGSTLLGSGKTAPFSFTWTGVSAGTYSLTAKAYDLDGGTASSSVTIDVGANQPPSISLTSPSSGATFTAPATLTLAATASDPEGQVAKVEFYAGSSLIGTAVTAPYSVSWSSVPAGTYSLTAVAYDAAGQSTASTAATVTVSPATVAPTKVVFQASADHATGVTSYRLDLFANGADPTKATPLTSSDLGKPAPAVNGDITVDRASLFSSLTPGTYIATVSAVGAGGESRSTAVSFSR